MEYQTPEEFFALIDAVEQDGGQLQDGLCKARTYSFSGPQGKPVTIGGCGNQAIFSIPYEATNKAGETMPGDRFVKVCAVDDDLGRWPRFGGDRFGRQDDS